MKRAIILAIAGVLSPMLLVAQTLSVPSAQAEKKQNHDPDAAELVFSDIDLFWKVYDRAKPENRAEMYIGYKICESYYKQAADKKEAINVILEINDFKAFLKASTYESRFAQAP